MLGSIPVVAISLTDVMVGVHSAPSRVRRPNQAKGSWKIWMTSCSVWAAAMSVQTSASVMPTWSWLSTLSAMS